MIATRSSLPNPGPFPTRGRRYDIDTIRVLAVLILYHVGMFYVADWGWHVKSAYTADWLKYPMLLVNQWRMALLFLISGAVVHFLLDKVSAGRFAWLRTKRLLIPLLFGMAVIIPPQAWLQAQANGAFDGGYLDFLVAYFTFQPWPNGAFDGSDIGITWNHLWFLPYLFSYTLVLALLLPVLRTRIVRAAMERFRSLRGVWLFVVPALPFIVIHALLADYGHTHAFVDDVRGHATFFTVFLLGFAIGRAEGLWCELVRRRWVALPLALITYGLLLVAWTSRSGAGEAVRAVLPALTAFNGWFWLMAVLGWGAYALNRPFKGLAYATEAVVSWYILHQTLTVMIGAGLARYALGPVIEPVLVFGGTVLGCLVLHEFVIRRSRILRPLFGLKPAGQPGIAREVAAQPAWA